MKKFVVEIIGFGTDPVTIEADQYRIDQNGFLHFNLEGDKAIDGPERSRRVASFRHWDRVTESVGSAESEPTGSAD